MAWNRLARVGLGRSITPFQPIAHRQAFVPRYYPILTPTSLRQPVQRRLASYQRFPNRDPRQQRRPESLLEKVRGYVIHIWNNYRKTSVGTIGGLGFFYVYNLEKVPMTGRRRFNCVPASLEEWLGEGNYRALLSDYRGRMLPQDHPNVVVVKRVLDRLLPAVEKVMGKKTDWRVHVINDPKTENAFVIPGGKIFVFTGILPICHDEDGLAAVLGHELSHNVAHHSAENMSSSVIVMGLVLAVSIALGMYSSDLSVVSNYLFSLPMSRTMETEADQMGLQIMAESCFNPEAARSVWERMEKIDKKAPPQILSTHPSNANRIKAITQWLPEAEDKYRSSGCGNQGRNMKSFSKTVAKTGTKYPATRGPQQPKRLDNDDDYFF